MRKLNLSTYYLIKNGINPRTIHKLKNNMNVTIDTIVSVCKLLNKCNIEDVVEVTFEDETK